jgi:hypothetical protein
MAVRRFRYLEGSTPAAMAASSAGRWPAAGLSGVAFVAETGRSVSTRSSYSQRSDSLRAYADTYRPTHTGSATVARMVGFDLAKRGGKDVRALAVRSALRRLWEHQVRRRATSARTCHCALVR